MQESLNPEDLPLETKMDNPKLRDEAWCVKQCISSVECVFDENLSEADLRKFLIDLKSI
jgi:hypothetical protein